MNEVINTLTKILEEKLREELPSHIEVESSGEEIFIQVGTYFEDIAEEIARAL